MQPKSALLRSAAGAKMHGVQGAARRARRSAQGAAQRGAAAAKKPFSFRVVDEKEVSTLNAKSRKDAFDQI